MQPDGNLVLYRPAGHRALWDSQTNGHPGAFAKLQRDGNLVVYTPSHVPLYSSATEGNPGAHLRVQDDGDVVIVSARRQVLWSSNYDLTHLVSGQTLRPQQTRRSADGRYLLAMQGDGNLVLFTQVGHTLVWSSQTSGHPGAEAELVQGTLVVFMPGGQVLFSSGDATGPATRLVVQNDGNTVIYAGAATALWSTLQDTAELTTGQFLFPGQSRRSHDGTYTLVMQPDGNLVLTRTASTQVLWASQTSSPGAWASLNDDGNFVLHAADGAVLWATNTEGGRGSLLRVQADGNLVLVSPAGAALWDTGT